MLALLPQGCAPEDSRPDVLLITIDTLRADHLGSYGFGYPTSPRIDALAAESVLFERAIAASSRTVPSHASIMTSRFTRGHSVGYLNGKSALRDRITLAEHFRRAGYETAGFVGNILLTHTTGLGAGFELFDDELETPQLNRPEVVERLAEDTTERALAWLSKERDAPFFLWVHYQDPHGPYTPPAADAARFAIAPAPGELPLPVGESNASHHAIPPYQALPGLELPSQYESRYAGEIFHADRSIGQLLDGFERASSGRESIVLLTADHGESFGETGRYFAHSYTTTPDVAHVPLLLRAPGLTPARRNEVVHHVDVLPTLLDLAGLPVPEDARGEALGPIVRGERALPKRYVYCDIGFQLSVYTKLGFVQIHDLEGAWGDGLPADGNIWQRFLWTPGRPWVLHREGRGPLLEGLREYAAAAEPMDLLPPPKPAMEEQLRALGYAE